MGAYLFSTIEQVQHVTKEWLRDCHAQRPREALGRLPPKHPRIILTTLTGCPLDRDAYETYKVASPIILWRREEVKMAKKLLSILVPLTAASILSACGGGDKTTTSSDESVALSGQVIDGPIEGAKVCVFANGQLLRNATGASVCSSETDAQGNYTVIIPKNIGDQFLTLFAAKGNDIKLASTLGTLSEVVEKAGNGNKVSATELPGAKVTHFTTANFVLADADNDGNVSANELASYIPKEEFVQKVAAVIKAVVDFRSQSQALLEGNTSDTFKLAAAAANGQPLGSLNQTLEAWYSDPANENIVNAVKKDAVENTNLANFFKGHTFVHQDHLGTSVVTYSDNGTARALMQDNGQSAKQLELNWTIQDNTVILTDANGRLTLTVLAMEGNTLTIRSSDSSHDEVIRRVVNPFSAEELSGRTLIDEEGKVFYFKPDGNGTDPYNGCAFKWSVENGLLVFDTQPCNGEQIYVYRASGNKGMGEQKVAVVGFQNGVLQEVFSGYMTFQSSGGAGGGGSGSASSSPSSGSTSGSTGGEAKPVPAKDSSSSTSPSSGSASGGGGSTAPSEPVPAGNNSTSPPPSEPLPAGKTWSAAELMTFFKGYNFVHQDHLGTSVVRYLDDGTAYAWIQDNGQPAKQLEWNWATEDNKVILTDKNTNDILTLNVLAIDGNTLTIRSSDSHHDEVARRVVTLFSTEELSGRSMAAEDNKAYYFMPGGTGAGPYSGCAFQWSVDNGLMVLDIPTCVGEKLYVYRASGSRGVGEQKVAVVGFKNGALQKVIHGSMTFQSN